MAKRVKATVTAPGGARIPGWIEDDGVSVHEGFNYADWARAAIEGQDYGGDPLDTAMHAAVCYLQYVAEHPDKLAEGDNREARTLRVQLDALREAMSGGDVRHAARMGVAFGEALEQMRVQLMSTGVRRGRKVVKGAADGHAAVHGTTVEKAERWEGHRKAYAAIKKRNPYLSHEDICRKTAEKRGVCLKTIKRHCPQK